MDPMLDRTAPTRAQMASALRIVGRAMERPVAWEHEGRFHFSLDGGWTLALSRESAGRVRIEACQSGVARATVWSSVEDYERLALLGLGMVGQLA